MAQPRAPNVRVSHSLVQIHTTSYYALLFVLTYEACMAAYSGTWNSIVFTVPSSPAAELRHWQQQANLRLMAGQIARRGEAHVVLRGEFDSSDIMELPAPGKADPMLGTSGGHFTYVFSPQNNTCILQVRVSPAALSFVGIEQIAPLELRLPVESVALRNTTPRYGHDWSGAELTVEGDTFTHEISREEPEFPINGTMYQRLVDWGWDPLQVEAYTYIFVPTTIGCAIVARHVASGREIYLTEGELD